MYADNRTHDQRGVRGILREALVVRGSRPTRVNWVVDAIFLVSMFITVTASTGKLEFPSAEVSGLIVAVWLPLLVRTLWPIPALVATVLAESLVLVFMPIVNPDVLTADPMGALQPAPLATLLAVYTVVSRSPRRFGWACGIGSGAILTAVSVISRDHELLLTDLVMFNLVILSTALGTIVSSRRDRVEHLAEERINETQRAVVDERMRIARELHDVLAHNLTLVNAQAAVAEYLMEVDPTAAKTALQGIAQHTGRAIDELRATIGLLRDEGDDGAESSGDPNNTLRPIPGLEQLEPLLEEFRSTGIEVRLSESGPRGQLGQHSNLAAYRIVQEALTNAVKHAPGVGVDVGLLWSKESVKIRVVNPTSQIVDVDFVAQGTGHGLIGMRERALAAGGTLQTERTPLGEFVVTATLPVDAADGARVEAADVVGDDERATTDRSDATAVTQVAADADDYEGDSRR